MSKVEGEKQDNKTGQATESNESRPKQQMPAQVGVGMGEREEHKQKMMPLVRFLKKNGLKFKNANCMNLRVEYFRIDMFHALVEEKQKQIQQQGLQKLVQDIKQDLVFYERPQSTEKLKYPQVLLPGDQNGKFASFKFDTTQSKRIYLVIVVLMILAGVLFPLWPYELKYGVWLVCLYLLISIVSIIILRLVLYIIAATFGVSFWLLPNLFGDYGILDSFKPFFSIQRWENDVVSIIIRLIAFGTFLYYCNSIYHEPEFYMENIDATKTLINDVEDWGVSKIKGEAANFSQRAITMENILNETQDAFDEPTADFSTGFEDQPQTE